jgi:hypothetical protein
MFFLEKQGIYIISPKFRQNDERENAESALKTQKIPRIRREAGDG